MQGALPCRAKRAIKDVIEHGKTHELGQMKGQLGAEINFEKSSNWMAGNRDKRASTEISYLWPPMPRESQDEVVKLTWEEAVGLGFDQLDPGLKATLESRGRKKGNVS